jgi:chemotaxis protein methyltransferase CheR
MTQMLANIVQHRPSPYPPIPDPVFVELRTFIYERTGIFFADKKKYLLEGRLGKRLQQLRLQGYDEYVHLLKYGANRNEEYDYLCDAVTINETFFFRNEPQFEAFEDVALPDVLAAKQKQGLAPRLRIWSAACSTGEEPYTLAILFLEKFRYKYPNLSFEIVGTDISPSVLQVASRGAYGEYSIRNLPPQLLEKYFHPEEGRYRLREEVRKCVRYQHLNLYDRQQMKLMRNFDVILCRNVLIYFDSKSKVQVVADLYNSLNYGGYLFIGHSELLHGISAAFKVKSFPKATAYKKE